MAPPNLNHWTTDAEYTEFLTYLIERTKNINSPMNMKQLARDFKEKSGASQTVKRLQRRIDKVRINIHNFEHIDKKTRVKMLFALSVSVNPKFLKELKKDAFVEVDGKNRITHYKANDGSSELIGDHSLSAKRKTAKRSILSWIIDYFENKNNADALPQNEEEKEMWNLISFITEKCEKANSPLSIREFAENSNQHFRTSLPPETIRTRVKGYCREIQTLEFLGTHSIVKQLFCLSAIVDSDYLEKLRENSKVEVDEKNRITHYKANDGSLELRGEHSQSSKTKTAMRESKRSLPLLIKNYFENKNNADAVPENEEEKEMWNLIDFITEKCVNVISPLGFRQLVKDFNKHFGVSRSLHCIHNRVTKYCHEIQVVEFLDTPAKVKQLFGLSATLVSSYLEKLRKDAVVEVDDLNRITKYTANDGHLTLYGDHSLSARNKLSWIARRKRGNTVKKQCNSVDDADEESDKENGYSEDDSDEYSSEEFGSEFDSDEENDPLDKRENITQRLKEADCSGISIENDFDFDSPTERSKRSEEKENDSGIKTRSGRLSNRRHISSEFSYNLANSRTSATPKSTDSSSSKSAKQKKISIQMEKASRSSNRCRSSTRSIRRSSRNSRFLDVSTESGENMENQDATEVEGNRSDPEDRMEPFNKADNFDSETPIRNRSPTEMTIADNFDFDPPTERSHRSEETEMRENAEKNNPNITENAGIKTRPGRLSKTNFSISHTPRTPKRNAVASGSNSSKRTKPSSHTSMNPGEMNENISHDDPLRDELKPFRGILEPPNGIEETPDIQQIPRPHPQVMDAPIKKEYVEEPRTSLKMVLNAFKSLTLSLDTPGLSQFQMEIDKKMMEAGRKSEVSNEELILAMEFLTVKLSKHGAVESSEDSISLRDVLLMLRTIILNSSFNGLEGILETLKENIEQLKVLDKRVSVSKVECVLRATLDNILT